MSTVRGPIMWYFDGSHRNLTLVDVRSDKRWVVNINKVPGFGNDEVYHPRWTNHPRFVAMSGPYNLGGANQVRSGGAQTEVYLGRFSANYSQVEAWARVTTNAAETRTPTSGSIAGRRRIRRRPPMDRLGLRGQERASTQSAVNGVSGCRPGRDSGAADEGRRDPHPAIDRAVSTRARRQHLRDSRDRRRAATSSGRSWWRNGRFAIAACWPTRTRRPAASTLDAGTVRRASGARRRTPHQRRRRSRSASLLRGECRARRVRMVFSSYLFLFYFLPALAAALLRGAATGEAPGPDAPQLRLLRLGESAVPRPAARLDGDRLRRRPDHRRRAHGRRPAGSGRAGRRAGRASR